MSNQNQQHDKDASNKSGNFANDPAKASEAGKKGGQQSHAGSKDDASKGQHGSTGSAGKQQGRNFANDPAKASEAGKKGGQASHGGSGSQGGSHK